MITVREKLNQIFRQEFVRHVLTLFTGSSLAQVIALAFYPVLTRLYNPVEFGVFSLFSTTAAILSIPATGSYERAQIIAPSLSEALSLKSFSIILCFAVNLLVALAVIIFLLILPDFFNQKYGRLLFCLVPLQSLFLGLFRIFTNFHNRKKQYARLSKANVLRMGSMVGMQSLLSFFLHANIGLAVGAMFGQALSTQYINDNKKPLPYRISRHTRLRWRIVARRYRHFPRFALPSALVNELSAQLPVYLLEYAFNTLVVGVFSLPQKILSQPMRLLGRSVLDVYMRRGAELLHENKSLSGLTFSIYRNLLLIGLLPFGIILFWGDSLFAFIFGNEWLMAGRFAQYISPWLLLVLAGSPISAIFTILERLKLSFYFNITLLIIRLTSLLIGGLYFQDAQLTILLFAIGSSLFWFGQTIYSLWLAKVNLVKAVGFTILACGSTGLFLWILEKLWIYIFS